MFLCESTLYVQFQSNQWKLIKTRVSLDCFYCKILLISPCLTTEITASGVRFVKANYCPQFNGNCDHSWLWETHPWESFSLIRFQQSCCVFLELELMMPDSEINHSFDLIWRNCFFFLLIWTVHSHTKIFSHQNSNKILYKTENKESTAWDIYLLFIVGNETCKCLIIWVQGSSSALYCKANLYKYICNSIRERKKKYWDTFWWRSVPQYWWKAKNAFDRHISHSDIISQRY